MSINIKEENLHRRKNVVQLFVSVGLKSAGSKIPDALCCSYPMKGWRREMPFWFYSNLVFLNRSYVAAEYIWTQKDLETQKRSWREYKDLQGINSSLHMP